MRIELINKYGNVEKELNNVNKVIHFGITTEIRIDNNNVEMWTHLDGTDINIVSEPDKELNTTTIQKPHGIVTTEKEKEKYCPEGYETDCIYCPLYPNCVEVEK